MTPIILIDVITAVVLSVWWASIICIHPVLHECMQQNVMVFCLLTSSQTVSISDRAFVIILYYVSFEPNVVCIYISIIACGRK